MSVSQGYGIILNDMHGKLKKAMQEMDIQVESSAKEKTSA
jgi:hypothetical protein